MRGTSNHDAVDSHGHEGHANIQIFATRPTAQSLLQIDPALIAEKLDLAAGRGIKRNQIIAGSHHINGFLTVVVIVGQAFA